MGDVMLEKILEQALRLSPDDRARLVEALTPKGESSTPPKEPLETFEGALAHLGPGPSNEDIDEVRREMWKDFPREDF